MALQSLGGGLVRWPEVHFQTEGLGTGNYTLDADGESITAVIWNPIERTVRGFVFAVPAIIAAGDLVCTMETVAAGLGTGTLIDANATVTVTVSDAGIQKPAFPADVTMPAGFIAFRIARVSGTANVVINGFWTGASSQTPVGIVVGSTVQAGYVMPLFGQPFAGLPPDETYLRLPYNWPLVDRGSAGTFGIGVGQSAMETGCTVTIPFKARAVGLAAYFAQSSAPAVAPSLRLIDSDGNTILASGSYAGPITSTKRVHFVPFDIPSPDRTWVLEVGKTYYLSVRALDASVAVSIQSLPIYDAAIASVAGVGPRLYRVGATDAWMESAAYLAIALVLDQIEDGVGTTPARADVHLGVI